MVGFTTILKSELFKLKRKLFFSIALLLPLFVSLIVVIYFAIEGVGKNPELETNYWMIYSKSMFQFYIWLYPLITPILAYSLLNIEFSNNGFNRIFTFPARRFYFFSSKVFILFLWTILSMAFAMFFLLAGGKLLKSIGLQGFNELYDLKSIVVFNSRLLIVIICLFMIHIFLSLISKSFKISVGIASFLVVFGLIFSRWEHSYLIPYSHPILFFNDFGISSSSFFRIELFWNVAFFSFFFIASFLQFVKTKNDSRFVFF